MIARGQTLVLFALTLFLLALAVMLTLSLGVKIKERTELQTVADVAAYNQAVVTARTFNSLAVVNRTEWSMLVAQSAAQSYLSWATAYRGAIDGIGDAVPATPACAQVRSAVAMERLRVDGLWTRLEPAGHAELQRLSQLQQNLLRGDARKDYALLEKLIGEDRVLDAVLAAARPGSARPMISTDDHRTFNKTQISRDCMSGVACDLARSDFDRNRRNFTILRHQHEVYTGTRGDPFTTARADHGVLARKLQSVLGLLSTVSWDAMGSSYRSSAVFTHAADYAFGPGNADYPQMAPDAAMSDDHGHLTVRLSGACRASFDFKVLAELRNGARADENVHTWSSAGVVRHCAGEHQRSHALPDLGGEQSWPLIIDFNDHLSPTSNLAQPRNRVELTRGQAQGAGDPWDLAFTFAGTDYNPERNAGRPRARATGIAYYHRGGDWAEPANFVNPFWQATLISNRWDWP